MTLEDHGLPPAAGRTKLHRREILIEGFARPDGLFDIDAVLHDTKTSDIVIDRGRLAAGDVLHGLAARMTVSLAMEIVDFTVAMDRTPSVSCETVPANFKALIGLTIGAGFVRAAYDRVGGTLGCTHIREMLQQMATVAFQSLYAQRRRAAQAREAASAVPGRPPLLNSCHGWRAGGEIIRNAYPAFYQAEGAGRASDA